MIAREYDGAEGREPAEVDVDRSPSGALRVAHFEDDVADVDRRALPAEALRGLSMLAAMGWVTPV